MFLAQVTFLGPEEGGRQHPPRSGYTPHVALGAIQTSCAIDYLGPTGEPLPDFQFTFGQPYEVRLRLMFPDQYGHGFGVGSTVNFYEGSRLVAHGHIVALE